MNRLSFFALVLVGSFVGFKIAGPVGLALSVLVAIVMDPNISSKLNRSRAINKIRKHNLSPADQTFFDTTFAMFAKLAKADGHVNRSEIEALEKIMTQVFSLGKVGRGIAISVFNDAKTDRTDFRQHALAFNKLYSGRPVVLGAMLESMFVVSVSDGELHQGEEKLLKSAASIFGIDEEVYASLHRKYDPQRSGEARPTASRGALVAACQKLGCKETDSIEVIKGRYRKLVQEHHPDKLAGKGLPEGFESFANEKFREIQEAFEVIKEEKGLS